MAYITKPTKLGWKLVHRQDSGEGVRERTVEKDSLEYSGLGLRQDFSREQANARLHYLRKENPIDRWNQVRARVDRQQVAETLRAIPPAVWKDFQTTARNVREDRLLIAQKLMATIPGQPQDWIEASDHVYQYCQSHSWSLDYTRRILSIINKFLGHVKCRKIPLPAGAARLQIRRAFNKKKPIQGTVPIPDEVLDSAVSLFGDAGARGVHFMAWFALRKREARRIFTQPEGEYWRIQTDDPRFEKVLQVYQEKLEELGQPKHLCWKAVPVVEPEQVKLLAEFEQKLPFKIPSESLLRKNKITARSARKTFETFMELRGYEQSCIVSWLGHIGSTVFTKHYKNKLVAHYRPPFLKRRA